MASSGKTEKLGLSLWEAADMPERLDFRQDNEKLERLVGGHLQDETLHLTTPQKEFITRPYWLSRYAGSGAKERLTVLPDVPEGVIILCMDNPPSLTGEDGKIQIYWDSWFRKTYTSFHQGMGGIEVDEYRKTIKVKTMESPRDSRYSLHMNDANVQYVMIFLKTAP